MAIFVTMNETMNTKRHVREDQTIQNEVKPNASDIRDKETLKQEVKSNAKTAIFVSGSNYPREGNPTRQRRRLPQVRQPIAQLGTASNKNNERGQTRTENKRYT